MITPEDFHKHLDNCSRCQEDENKLCAVGAELLKLAAAALPKMSDVLTSLPFVPEWGEIERRMLGKNMFDCAACDGTGRRQDAVCETCNGTGRLS